MGKNKSYKSGKQSSHPYKKHFNKNNASLPPGIKGFLCTFNTMKRQGDQYCMKEAYNILNEYVENINELDENLIKNTFNNDKALPKNEDGAIETTNELTESKCNQDKNDITKTENETVSKNNSNSDDDIDIEDELNKELNELKNKTKTKPKFEKLDTGANGNLFIKLNDSTIDPIKLGTYIIEDMFKTKQCKSKNLLRFIPVEIVCKAYIDDISKAFEHILDKYFSAGIISYCIVFNKRNNNNLDRGDLIKHIAILIKERNLFHRVDLKNATHTILFEVIKSVACISVLKDYYKYKKYNLLEITYPETVKNDKIDEEQKKDAVEIDEGQNKDTVEEINTEKGDDTSEDIVLDEVKDVGNDTIDDVSVENVVDDHEK